MTDQAAKVLATTYDQRSGAFKLKGDFLATCYSGNDLEGHHGLNNPAAEAEVGHGPLPRGGWRIQQWDNVHGGLGKDVAILVPVGHNAHGRSLFRIHGDNEHMDHTASDGCIIMNHDARLKLRQSGVMEFEVI